MRPTTALLLTWNFSLSHASLPSTKISSSSCAAKPTGFAQALRTKTTTKEDPATKIEEPSTNIKEPATKRLKGGGEQVWRYPWQSTVASLVGRFNCLSLLPQQAEGNGTAEVFALHGDVLIKLFVLEEFGAHQGNASFGTGHITKCIGLAQSNNNLAKFSHPLLVETGLVEQAKLTGLSNHSIATAVEAAISATYNHADPQSVPSPTDALRQICKLLLHQSRNQYDWKAAFMELNSFPELDTVAVALGTVPPPSAANASHDNSSTSLEASLSVLKLVGEPDHLPKFVCTASCRGRVVVGEPQSSVRAAEFDATEKFCKRFNPEWICDRFPEQFVIQASLHDASNITIANSNRQLWKATVTFGGTTQSGDLHVSKTLAVRSAQKAFVANLTRAGMMADIQKRLTGTIQVEE